MDTLTIPAMYIGQPDAQFSVEGPDYFDRDSYTMTLTAADGHIIARADGFRPGACQDFDADVKTAETFGAFLSNALEDHEARESWEIIADDAGDWTDALCMLVDYERETFSQLRHALA